MLYFSLVEIIPLYGISVWRKAAASHISKATDWQIRIIKALANKDSSFDDQSDVLELFNTVTPKTRMYLKISSLNIGNDSVRKTVVHTHNTRIRISSRNLAWNTTKHGQT
jgi:hypothetical protein